MPFIDVTISQGRTPEQIRSLIHELTDAAHRAVDAPLSNIRVVVREVPETHWAAGDVTIAERHAGDGEFAFAECGGPGERVGPASPTPR